MVFSMAKSFLDPACSWILIPCIFSFYEILVGKRVFPRYRQRLAIEFAHIFVDEVSILARQAEFTMLPEALDALSSEDDVGEGFVKNIPQ
jgi:hypothetical protein